MTRSELIAHLCADFPDLSAADANRCLNIFFGSIERHVVADGRVEVRGFGSFVSAQLRAETRSATMLGAGKSYPDRRRIRFKASPSLLARLQPTANAIKEAENVAIPIQRTLKDLG